MRKAAAVKWHSPDIIYRIQVITKPDDWWHQLWSPGWGTWLEALRGRTASFPPPVTLYSLKARHSAWPTMKEWGVVLYLLEGRGATEIIWSSSAREICLFSLIYFFVWSSITPVLKTAFQRRCHLKNKTWGEVPGRLDQKEREREKEEIEGSGEWGWGGVVPEDALLCSWLGKWTYSSPRHWMVIRCETSDGGLDT